MDKGQVCMDFLIAITIIAFGIVILLSQIPMLFAPFQTVATDIQPVAYRTSMILVEDGGIYNSSSGELASDWESEPGFDRDRLLRIGLARRAPEWSSSEDVLPNNLSRKKIEALQEWWNDGNDSTEGNSSLIIQKLGLNVTYNNIPLNYSYNISLKAFNESLIWNSTSNRALLQIGDSIPVSGVTIEKIERIVAIDDPTTLNCEKIGDVNVKCAKLVVCIWR